MQHIRISFQITSLHSRKILVINLKIILTKIRAMVRRISIRRKNIKTAIVLNLRRTLVRHLLQERKAATLNIIRNVRQKGELLVLLA